MRILLLKSLWAAVLFALCLPVSAQAPKIDPKKYGFRNDPEQLFLYPPESAKPGVLWMWMGSNINKEGITKDLESLKEEGINATTMETLADITVPWSSQIAKGPTPELDAWSEPWWNLVRYAAQESKRLNMTMGMPNVAGYTTSGGTWITPELSMQQLCWSGTKVKGGAQQQEIKLEKPTVNLHANQLFPAYDPATGKIEIPEVPERGTYYRDIAILAMPATDTVLKQSMVDLSGSMDSSGKLVWNAPAGDWIIYRFGHTTMGARVQPAQSRATGFECDKMSEKAVLFHIDHVITEMKNHLGSLIGSTVDHLFFDSYEQTETTWTPEMRQQFSSRRGYDLLPYLAVFAGRTIEGKEQTLRFRLDFTATIRDLYRDVYFKTIARELKAAHLKFFCEPYGGPWRQEEVFPLISDVMGEFWTHDGVYSPYELENVISIFKRLHQNILTAEALTGQPADSRWDETPAWLKPIADEAFCAGINKIIIHRFVEQPWDERYKPGATMGQWGTHFDRTQTWWKPAKAMVYYWRRCQAVLQWGNYVPHSLDDFGLQSMSPNMVIKYIHRKDIRTDLYFIANTSHYPGEATCAFDVHDRQPEIWDPVTGTTRDLPGFSQKNGKTIIQLKFEDAQSYFIVFRKKVTHRSGNDQPNFPQSTVLLNLNAPWKVAFDAAWGGPSTPMQFDTLQDWTLSPVKGIKYYSGTAVYTTRFSLPENIRQGKATYLDLGKVGCIVRVRVNNTDLGVIWTAPWKVKIPAGVLRSTNELKIEVTNVWANRLIGDEQEPEDMTWLPNQYYYNSGKYLKEFPGWFLKNEPRPSGKRYCFTTWNYFDRSSQLIPSGLLGPVCITAEH